MIDFRSCLYGLSDVIINRPSPLRLFDQIYMKLPDMLLQAELTAQWCTGKTVLYIGDGDAIALAMMHLSKLDLIKGKPEHVTVLDFDERIVNSVNHFARQYDMADRIYAELYNVADPLPEKHWGRYDAFYTNPPWGASNAGDSVRAFVERGIEGVKPSALGFIIIGDHSDFAWTHQVLRTTQELTFEKGFCVAEMIHEFHRYHLDDSPELTSCCLVVKRLEVEIGPYKSKRLSKDRLDNFYGADSPLLVHYVRDLINGGKLDSRDYQTEPWIQES
jgi:predicted methyltransferase